MADLDMYSVEVSKPENAQCSTASTSNDAVPIIKPQSQEETSNTSVPTNNNYQTEKPKPRYSQPFFILCAEMREELKNKDVKITEISKIAGQRWRSMTEEEKQPYFNIAQEVREEKQAKTKKNAEDADSGCVGGQSVSASGDHSQNKDMIVDMETEYCSKDEETDDSESDDRDEEEGDY